MMHNYHGVDFHRIAHDDSPSGCMRGILLAINPTPSRRILEFPISAFRVVYHSLIDTKR